MDAKKRVTEEQIVNFLKEADAGLPVKDRCRKHGSSEASSYRLWTWRMPSPEGTEAGKQPAETAVADAMLENEVKEALRIEVVNAPATRLLVL